VAALETTFNFGVRYGQKMLIDLYALPDSGPARRLGTVEAPWMSMVHDFMATERHLVLFMGPVQLVLWRALLGLFDFSKLFRQRPELGARMIVVPLDDIEHPRTFELEPFWLWHFANAFDVDGGVHVDVCRYDEFSLADIGTNEGAGLPSLARLHLDLATGRSEWLSRSRDAVEFPQVHPRVQGALHKNVFAQTRNATGEDAISRIDTAGRASSWTLPKGHLPSEPVLVPRSDAEDDVWVLDLVLDGERKTSYLAVLDGQRLPEGPLAKLHFDQAIPLTFHGVFVEPKAAAI
jgi:carotenoid cleavage dioxygenase-like enzyme